MSSRASTYLLPTLLALTAISSAAAPAHALEIANTWHAATWGGLCGKTPVRDTSGVYLCESEAPLRLVGDTQCAFGSRECNRAAAGAADYAFHDVHTYWWKDEMDVNVRYDGMIGVPLEPSGDVIRGFGVDTDWDVDSDYLSVSIELEDTQLDHVQGVGRFQRDDGAWFAVSRSDFDESGKAGFWVARLDEGLNDSGMLSDAYEGENLGQTVAYYRMPGTVHPGGLQVLGDYVLIAKECTDSYSCAGRGGFEVWDLADPLHGRKIKDVNFERYNTRIPGRPHRASSIGATRLADGRYLVAVAGAGTEEMWFYATRANRIDSEWVMIDHQEISSAPSDVRNGWREWQSISFIVDVDGGIYMMGATGDALNTVNELKWIFGSDHLYNEFNLFALYGHREKGVGMEYIPPDMFDYDLFQTDVTSYCSARAAAGAYVDRWGRLAIYCHSDMPTDGGNFKIQQMTAGRTVP